MRKKSILFLFIAVLLVLSNGATAQKLTAPQQQQLAAQFKTKKIVYFKFKVNSMQEVAQMAKIISVDKVKGVDVAAHATKEQFAKFLPYNYKYVVSASSVKKKTVPAKKTTTTKKAVQKK